MIQLSSKNNCSSLCYDVIITHQILKIHKFGDFSWDINCSNRTDVFRDVIPFIINIFDTGALRAPPLDLVSANPTAQANEALVYIIYISRDYRGAPDAPLSVWF